MLQNVKNISIIDCFHFCFLLYRMFLCFPTRFHNPHWVSFITNKVSWKTFFTTFHQIEKAPRIKTHWKEPQRASNVKFCHKILEIYLFIVIWNHGNHGNHGTLFFFNTHECQETQFKNPFEGVNGLIGATSTPLSDCFLGNILEIFIDKVFKKSLNFFEKQLVLFCWSLC